MLWTIAVILFVLWILGFLAFHVASPLIHLLLVIAVVVILVRVIDGVMKKGQQIVLTYVPGSGTTVDVNGKAKGVLQDKAVADAILTTWIGPKPGPGEDFKKGILGK